MIHDKDRKKYMKIIKKFWTEEDIEQMHEATIGGIVGSIHMALKEHEQRSEPVSLKRFVMCTDVAIDAIVNRPAFDIAEENLFYDTMQYCFDAEDFKAFCEALCEEQKILCQEHFLNTRGYEDIKSAPNPPFMPEIQEGG